MTYIGVKSPLLSRASGFHPFVERPFISIYRSYNPIYIWSGPTLYAHGWLDEFFGRNFKGYCFSWWYSTPFLFVKQHLQHSQHIDGPVTSRIFGLYTLELWKAVGDWQEMHQRIHDPRDERPVCVHFVLMRNVHIVNPIASMYDIFHCSYHEFHQM